MNIRPSYTHSGTGSTPAPGASTRQTGIAPGLISLPFDPPQCQGGPPARCNQMFELCAVLLKCSR